MFRLRTPTYIRKHFWHDRPSANPPSSYSQEQLITPSSKYPSDADWVVMDDLSGQVDDQKNITQREEEVPDTGDIPPAPLASSSLVPTATTHGIEDELLGSNSDTQFRVYKRRWFGLIQLVLLNIVVSWDVSYAFCCLVCPGMLA